MRQRHIAGCLYAVFQGKRSVKRRVQFSIGICRLAEFWASTLSMAHGVGKAGGGDDDSAADVQRGFA
jgi:hypothetical protein